MATLVIQLRTFVQYTGHGRKAEWKTTVLLQRRLQCRIYTYTHTKSRQDTLCCCCWSSAPQPYFAWRVLKVALRVTIKPSSDPTVVLIGSHHLVTISHHDLLQKAKLRADSIPVISTSLRIEYGRKLKLEASSRHPPQAPSGSAAADYPITFRKSIRHCSLMPNDD